MSTNIASLSLSLFPDVHQHRHTLPKRSGTGVDYFLIGSLHAGMLKHIHRVGKKGATIFFASNLKFPVSHLVDKHELMLNKAFKFSEGVYTFLWSRYGIGQTIILLPCGFFFLSSFFPRLISAVGDWMSATLPHMVWP